MDQVPSGLFSVTETRLAPRRALLGALMRVRICPMRSTQLRIGGSGLMDVCMNMCVDLRALKLDFANFDRSGTRERRFRRISAIN